MSDLPERIQTLDWETLGESLTEKGYALAPGLLKFEECAELIAGFEDDERFRKTVVMEQHQYGQGKYRYYQYPLPQTLQTIRETSYPFLAPLANQWMEWLRLGTCFPATFPELIALCHQHEQKQPTALILRYGDGGYNALHQDLYGDIWFPMQIVLFLNEPERDYQGGEFVLVQQIPRAQSRATVLRPGLGDMLIFPTNFRPLQGKRGYTRAPIRHGVSEVRSGIRHTAGIIFHDALK